MSGGDGSARDAVTPSQDEFRSLSVEQMIERIRLHGEPDDPRMDIDTPSLRKRFPHLRGVTLTDITTTAEGRTLAGRAYVDPSASRCGEGLVWAHGGAFLGGNLDMPEANWVAMELAAAGIPVLSIDYAKCLGDVHFPTPVEDVLAWWRLARQECEDVLGVDAEHLSLGGASAGATLTAGAVQRLIDEQCDVPRSLVLVYPALHPDPTLSSGSSGSRTAAVPGLSLNYAGTIDALTDPQAFAGMGEGRGYPPTLIVACEHDDFAPSAVAFEATLREAGGVVTLRVEKGADHGHIDEPSDESAHRTIRAMRDWFLTL